MTKNDAFSAPKCAKGEQGFNMYKFGTDLLSGGVAAAVSKTAVAPIERVKLLLQVQDASQHIAKGKRYRGIVDVLVRVPKEQGAQLRLQGHLQRDLHGRRGQEHAVLHEELGLRTGSREFNGMADCFMKILKADGPVGLYRGFLVSVQGIFIYRAAYFGCFDTVKMLVTSEGKQLNFFANWAIAQVVTIASGVLFLLLGHGPLAHDDAIRTQGHYPQEHA